jgi:hypothetical protein
MQSPQQQTCKAELEATPLKLRPEPKQVQLTKTKHDLAAPKSARQEHPLHGVM